MRAHCLIFGQEARFWRDFVQELADRQRVPHPHALVGEAGHEDRGREQQDFRPRVSVAGGDDHLVEVDFGELGHQPAAQRPGRIVLAAEASTSFATLCMPTIG